MSFIHRSNISTSLSLPTFIQYIKKTQTFKEPVAKKYHQKGSKIAQKREVYNMSLIVDYVHALAVKVSSQHIPDHFFSVELCKM